MSEGIYHPGDPQESLKVNLEIVIVDKEKDIPEVISKNQIFLTKDVSDLLEGYAYDNDLSYKAALTSILKRKDFRSFLKESTRSFEYDFG
jgi:hypothetical protein